MNDTTAYALREWRDIPGAAGYKASNDGRVKGPRRMLRPSLLNSGYLGVRVAGKSTTVHAAVLSAFAGLRPSPEHTANHKDGNKRNNRIENLEWVTHSENLAHARDVLGVRFGPEPNPVDYTDNRQPGRLLLQIHGRSIDINLQPDPRDVRMWRAYRDGQPWMRSGLERIWRALQAELPPTIGRRHWA